MRKFLLLKLKKTLEAIIESENKQKPLTDDQLTKLLNKEGYFSARRTVAKYREMIGAQLLDLEESYNDKPIDSNCQL